MYYNHALRCLRYRELGINNNCRLDIVKNYETKDLPTTSIRLRQHHFEEYPYLKSKLEMNIEKMKFSIGFSPTDIKQLKLFHCTKHLKHDGCVNTASWLRDFCHLVTGSDDRLIKIWKMDNDIHLRHTITTGHRSNIFCVEQSPLNPDIFYTCAADGELRVCNVNTNIPNESVASTSHGMMHMFKCSPHNNYELLTAQADGHAIMYDTRLSTHRKIFDVMFHKNKLNPNISVRCVEFHPLDPFTFILGGEAGTNIQVYDRRKVNVSNSSAVNNNSYPVYEISLASFYNGKSSDKTFSDVSASTPTNQRYLRRSIFEVEEIADKLSISCLGYNKYGTKLLVNIMGGDVICLDLAEEGGKLMYYDSYLREDGIQNGLMETCEVRRYKPHNAHGVYFGAPNSQTFLKTARFFGPKEEYIVAGSDLGRAYIWDSKTCQIQARIRADRSVCNGVIPHPVFNYLITYGIDRTAKVWHVSKIEATRKDKSPGKFGFGRKFVDDDDDIYASLMHTNNENVNNQRVREFLLWRSGKNNKSGLCRSFAQTIDVIPAFKLWKQLGNENFKAGKLFKACKCYGAAMIFNAEIQATLNRILRKGESQRTAADINTLNETHNMQLDTHDDVSALKDTMLKFGVSCITNMILVKIKFLETISSKNYAKKTSRELHKDEISLLANVALRDANSTIKSRENYLCECKDEDFGLLKISKLYFLRGRANYFAGNYEDAITDFEQSSNYNPKNKLIVKHLKRTKSILKRKEQKLASNMKKMFA